MPGASLGGLRVLTLESRRANEVGKLIRTYGGEPMVAPAMREIPLDSNQPRRISAEQRSGDSGIARVDAGAAIAGSNLASG